MFGVQFKQEIIYDDTKLLQDITVKLINLKTVKNG